MGPVQTPEYVPPVTGGPGRSMEVLNFWGPNSARPLMPRPLMPRPLMVRPLMVRPVMLRPLL